MIPKSSPTGCLRNSYRADPFFVPSRCAILATGSSVRGAGAPAAKRSSTGTWCDSRFIDNSGSIDRASQASTLAALKQPVSADRLDTLRQEVQPPLKLAEDRGSRPLDDGLDVPAAIARRAQRLGAIAQAEARTEQRARERQAVKQQDCDAECVKRQAPSAKQQAPSAKRRAPRPTR